MLSTCKKRIRYSSKNNQRRRRKRTKTAYSLVKLEVQTEMRDEAAITADHTDYVYMICLQIFFCHCQRGKWVRVFVCGEYMLCVFVWYLNVTEWASVLVRDIFYLYKRIIPRRELYSYMSKQKSIKYDRLLNAKYVGNGLGHEPTNWLRDPKN